MMEHNYNFTTNEIWTPDYIDHALTNSQLCDNTRRVVRDINTVAGALSFDGRNVNVMDSGLIYTEDTNFNNHNSYYQYPSACFVPGRTGQSPVLQPSPLGLHGFDPNLPNSQSLNHSMVSILPRNTTYQHEVPGFSGYLNPSHAGLNPTLPLAQHHIASNQIPTNGSVSKTGRYFCSFCSKSFTRKKDMERHAGAHLPPTLWCPVLGCDKGFYRKDKLREHGRKHGGGSLPINGAIM